MSPNLDDVIVVWFTADEYALVEKAAALESVTVEEFCRRAVLNKIGEVDA